MTFGATITADGEVLGAPSRARRAPTHAGSGAAVALRASDGDGMRRSTHRTVSVRVSDLIDYTSHEGMWGCRLCGQSGMFGNPPEYGTDSPSGDPFLTHLADTHGIR